MKTDKICRVCGAELGEAHAEDCEIYQGKVVLESDCKQDTSDNWRNSLFVEFPVIEEKYIEFTGRGYESGNFYKGKLVNIDEVYRQGIEQGRIEGYKKGLTRLGLNMTKTENAVEQAKEEVRQEIREWAEEKLKSEESSGVWRDAGREDALNDILNKLNS